MIKQGTCLVKSSRCYQIWKRTPPTLEELEEGINRPKNRESPGINDIPVELIKAGGKEMIIEIHKLIDMYWKIEKTPESTSKSIAEFH